MQEIIYGGEGRGGEGGGGSGLGFSLGRNFLTYPFFKTWDAFTPTTPLALIIRILLYQKEGRSEKGSFTTTRDMHVLVLLVGKKTTTTN